MNRKGLLVSFVVLISNKNLSLSLFHEEPSLKWEEFINQIKINTLFPTDLSFSLADKLIEKQDFSNLSLKRIRFYRCTFKNVNLTNTDLTDITFEECVFQDVNLSGATLAPNFKLNDKISEFELVSQYFRFLKTGMINQTRGLTNLAKQDFDRSEALLKILLPLNIYLNDRELDELDLMRIHLMQNLLKNNVLEKAHLYRKLLYQTWCDKNYPESWKKMVKDYKYLIDGRWRYALASMLSRWASDDFSYMSEEQRASDPEYKHYMEAFKAKEEDDEYFSKYKNINLYYGYRYDLCFKGAEKDSFFPSSRSLSKTKVF